MTINADLRARAILSRLGANPRGVELGVYRGALSRRLLVRRDLHLTMVDKWGDHTRAYAASGDLLATHDETEWHNIREAADVHTRWADDRRKLVKSDSVAAAQDCPDASLDFVFIDADHSYEGATADILAWVGKVRPGGLLGGHDYHAPDYPLWGVKRAVDEFAADRSLMVELGDDDTWFIRMPGPLPEASAEYDQIIVACVLWTGRNRSGVMKGGSQGLDLGHSVPKNSGLDGSHGNTVSVAPVSEVHGLTVDRDHSGPSGWPSRNGQEGHGVLMPDDEMLGDLGHELPSSAMAKSPSVGVFAEAETVLSGEVISSGHPIVPSELLSKHFDDRFVGHGDAAGVNTLVDAHPPLSVEETSDVIDIKHTKPCPYNAGYVNILADMVARNCELPYQLWCFTDDPTGLAEDVFVKSLPPGLVGWWNKIALFKPGTFPAKTRVLFLDLDVVVCGPIEPLINTCGIAADWLQGGYNSSVMCWDEGDHWGAWAAFDHAYMDQYHGDQDWLTALGGWSYLPPDWIVSYRLHAQTWPPKDAIVVAFHGLPKPAEITTGWVPEMWTMAGLAIPRYTSILNNDITTIRANVAANKRPDVPSVTVAEAHGRHLIICAGGPSLADNLPAIQLERTRTGADLWALNGAHDYLIDRGIVPSAMVMLDSRLACVDAFLRYPISSCEYLIATQCDPFAFQRLNHYRLKRWTGWYWGVEDELVIGGGATVGLKSIMLAAAMGYRRFSLYGYDSSYRDGADHAYPQEMNANDLRVDIVLYGRKFVAARWMAKQVVEFLQMAHDLTASFGCEFRINGDGLLPFAASIASKERMAA